MSTIATADGIHARIPVDQLDEAKQRYWNAFLIVPDAPLYHTEFGFYCNEAWQEQGLDPEADYATEFGYSGPAGMSLTQLGWCWSRFYPEFPRTVLEDRGDYELVQDEAGRGVLCFKGRRQGFMPEYLTHPVHDMRSWEEQCKWRLDPNTPERIRDIEAAIPGYVDAAGKGFLISQNIMGGYMYLRSLIGPEELLYAFYDEPELIHDCMRTWFELADAVTARHQRHVSFDRVFLAEDICYNAGPLIGPDMMHEFLIPYYQQLLGNIRRRQIDQERHLFIEVDTDGNAPTVIDTYREGIGMDCMSPFEVASGCDVVAIGKQYPDLHMRGGIDKRILAKGPEAIDRELDRIIPAMRRRGGYIPVCDHGVPPEVSLANYRHYRKRMLELGG